MQPGRRIRSSVLVGLVVLSLCLSLFAHGQEPAVGVTRQPAADLWRRLVAPKSDVGGSQTEAETVVLPKSVPDPLEPFNRVVWGFNKAVMTGVIKPTSRVYRFFVVKPVRTGIGNFGRNITYPGRLINNLLQGKWSGARDEPTGSPAIPPLGWPAFSTWRPNGRYPNPTRILARRSANGAGSRSVS